MIFSWPVGPEKKSIGVEKGYREEKDESKDYVLLDLLVKLGTATSKLTPWKKLPWYTKNSKIKQSKIFGP